MAFLVTITTVMPESVYAAQVTTGGLGRPIISVNGIPSAGQTSDSGEALPNESESLDETDSLDEIDSSDELGFSEETVSGDEIDSFGEKGKLNYLYLENKFIETPGEQNVLVGFGDEETVITGGTLELKNYDTEEILTYSSEDALDNAILFNMAFSSEEKGIYEVTGVTVRTEDGKETRVPLSDTGMAKVYFGVDEEFSESEEEIDLLDASSIEMQIVSFDESISEVETESITAAVENALDEAKEAVIEEQVSRPQTYSAAVPMAANAVAPISAGGKLVVVLDPGHDATHAGASANGLREEELTLKIAQYCKAELEQYNGVAVYMTRTSASCPHPGTTSTVDNYDRVEYAKSVGADIYVSIHLNSAGASAKGSEVYYPNPSYNSNIGTKGANLATQILRQLKALGLADRGIKIRNSEDNSLYPDGSLADYYGVIKNSKLAGFPGVIIEHAFVTNAEDAAFLKNEANLKNIGVADATGIANYLGLSKIKITSSAPVIQNVNNGAGTFEVSVSGVSPVASVSNVRVGVWSAANGQDDLKWYNMTNTGNGTYKLTIDIKNHNYETGLYNAHVYATDIQGGSHFLGGPSCVIDKVTAKIDKLSATVSADEKNVTITATSSTGLSNLRFAVWSAVNGQDDLIWYTAKNSGNGTWSVTVPVSAHKGSSGVYNVHAYGGNIYASNSLLGNVTFNIAGPTKGTVSAKNVNEGAGTFTAEVRGASSASGISEVRIAVWSKSDQSNIKWYTAAKQSDGSYAVNVNLANHGYEYGKYNIHAYVKDGNGIQILTAGSVTISQPKAVVTAAGNGNQTQYALRASNVGYAGGVKEVRFAVWSVANGQDDIVWYKGQNNGSGVWSANAVIANHKTAGTYNVHMYIVDAKGGLHLGGSTTFSVNANTASSVSLANVRESDGTFTVQINGVSAVSGISNVRVAVWCAANQRDIVWYSATDLKNGNYQVGVDVRNHQSNTGTYQIHVYVTGKNGVNTLVGSTTCRMLNVTNILHPIMGSTSVTVDQLVAYYNSSGATYPSYYAGTEAPTLRQFCQIYINECNAEGVKAEVAFVQAMKETNFLRYGGDVNISQFNFAGIGATGGGVPGNSFSSVTVGIRAQVQHLKAYASNDPLNQGCVDPRFQYVTRNTAPYCEWLGINENPYKAGWATAVRYGYDIVDRLTKLKQL